MQKSISFPPKIQDSYSLITIIILVGINRPVNSFMKSEQFEIRCFKRSTGEFGYRVDSNI